MKNRKVLQDTTEFGKHLVDPGVVYQGIGTIYHSHKKCRRQGKRGVVTDEQEQSNEDPRSIDLGCTRSRQRHTKHA